MINIKTVDDKIFGGGSGLLMKPDVISECIQKVTKQHPKTKLLCTSPSGKLLNQNYIKDYLCKYDNISILCPRFEGVDHRIIKYYDIEEISIGDYIMSGGELAAMVIIDTILRYTKRYCKKYK